MSFKVPQTLVHIKSPTFEPNQKKIEAPSDEKGKRASLHFNRELMILLILYSIFFLLDISTLKKSISLLEKKF